GAPGPERHRHPGNGRGRAVGRAPRAGGADPRRRIQLYRPGAAGWAGNAGRAPPGPGLPRPLAHRFPAQAPFGMVKRGTARNRGGTLRPRATHGRRSRSIGAYSPTPVTRRNVALRTTMQVNG